MTPLFGKDIPEDVTIVAVLGMHRSGTSWLAGSLQEMGLELGDVNTKAKFNQKGNRENQFLMHLHEAVLEANGGSWRSPKFPNSWTRSQSKKLTKHIARMSRDHKIWGFKDPRTLLLIDEWRKQVPRLVRVGIYRHPRSVYASLKNRHDDFTEDEAFALWQTYNERLIDEHEREPFPVMRFDVAQPVLFGQLERLTEPLDLSGRHSFFDTELVHNSVDDEVVPSALSRVWERLEAMRIELPA